VQASRGERAYLERGIKTITTNKLLHAEVLIDTPAWNYVSSEKRTVLEIRVIYKANVIKASQKHDYKRFGILDGYLKKNLLPCKASSAGGYYGQFVLQTSHRGKLRGLSKPHVLSKDKRFNSL
jgi:hypothetical protein